MKTIRLGRLKLAVCTCATLTNFDMAAARNSVSNAAVPVAAEELVSQLEQPPVMAVFSKSHKTETALLPPVSTAVDAPSFLQAAPPFNTKLLEGQNALDLSLPFKTADEVAPVFQKTNLFAADRKKSQAIRVDGNILMTQELEAEKRKTLDGAGIMINLKSPE